jgi:hypothetical protein
VLFTALGSCHNYRVLKVVYGANHRVGICVGGYAIRVNANVLCMRQGYMFVNNILKIYDW